MELKTALARSSLVTGNAGELMVNVLGKLSPNSAKVYVDVAASAVKVWEVNVSLALVALELENKLDKSSKDMTGTDSFFTDCSVTTFLGSTTGATRCLSTTGILGPCPSTM